MTEANVELTTAEQELGDLVKGVKMYKWRVYAKYFKMSSADILGDELTLLVVAANEKHTKDGNKDNLLEFDNYSLGELQTYLGLDEDESV